MNLVQTEQSKFTSKWWSLIKDEFEQEYMHNIYSKLRQSKYKILPKSNEIFKQFRDCDFNQTFVVFITPYPIVEFAKSRVWQYMSMLVEYECFNGLNLDHQDNMDYLLNQHVIHIPVSFTQSQPGTEDHMKLGWQTFGKRCIKELNNGLNKILWIYEDDCMEMLEGIDFKKHQVELLEPGCMKKINEFMKKEYNLTVKW